jgi:uncharacterized protein YcnI
MTLSADARNFSGPAGDYLGAEDVRHDVAKRECVAVRLSRILGVVAAGVMIGALAFAGAASAHVTVNPDTSMQGGFPRIAFRVPNESDTASTTKLDVFLDMAHPVPSVSIMPVPGWTAKTVTSKLATPLTNDDGDQVTEAVSEIAWTADSPASAIKPGEFNEFPVSLGPLPDVPSLTFKVLQTYSDGSVVRWIDPTPAGGPEPEHPAPVLTLAAAGSSDSSGPTVSSATGAVTATSSGGSNGGAMTLAIIGALLGLVGAVLGGAAYARTRSAAPVDESTVDSLS